MAWIIEKLSEFQVLLYDQTPEGDIRLSKHKILLLVLYSGAFLLTFLHFANIPSDEIVSLQISGTPVDQLAIQPSRFLSLAVLFYLYITFIALISIYKDGSPPNFFSRPQLPSIRNRYKAISVVLILFFGGFLLFLAILLIFSSALLLFYIGPALYIIWMILEPYFLLSGILAIIRLIERDYPLEGLSSKMKRYLVVIFALGYITPTIFAIFLFMTSTSAQFSTISFFGLSFSFYRPALENFSKTITSVLSLTLLFMLVWWIKDRNQGKSPLRERKKGMLPLFLSLTLIFIILNVVPLIASTSGSLQEMTSIIDIIALIIAVIMGLWNTLGVERVVDPIRGLKRLNPLVFIPRLHPYTKALFILVISMFAFYSSLESSTLAVITGLPDEMKLIKLELFAGLIGWAFVVLLWRYKGQPRSTTPGLLKSTHQQLEDKFLKIKSIIGGKPVDTQFKGYEEE